MRWSSSFTMLNRHECNSATTLSLLVQSQCKRKSSVCAWIRCRSDNIKQREEEESQHFPPSLSRSRSIIIIIIVERLLFCSRNERISMYFFFVVVARSCALRRCCYGVGEAYSFSFTGQCLLRTLARAQFSC